MSIDERPVALPKLYGAPAYARPPAPVVPAPRPFDPDLLPLESCRTEDERSDAGPMAAHVYASTIGPGQTGEPADRGPSTGLRPRQLSLRAIAGRLLGGQ